MERFQDFAGPLWMLWSQHLTAFACGIRAIYPLAAALLDMAAFDSCATHCTDRLIEGNT